MSLNCIVVDDEKLAQNVLEKYIDTLPSLTLLKKCNTALEAISFMHETAVDLVFLDIDMPELSGIEMIKTLNTKPMVVLTTAYSEYALESYEYGVVDYLLKPISIDRFLKAVNRAINMMTTHKNEVSTEKSKYHNVNHILLKESGVTYNIPQKDILYIEANGNYLNVFTKGKKYMIREKMHVIQKKLPEELFLRVHKSYIISLNELNSFEGNRLKIGETIIPIGGFYKSQLIKQFYKNS